MYSWVWCRKSTACLWKKYILFFLKLYLIHISSDILLLRAHNAINNANDAFPESCYGKSYENVKLVNLPSCWAAQLPLIFYTISKKYLFQGRGKCKFFCGSDFCTHDHKNHYSELKNCLLTICIQFKLIYWIILRYKQIHDEKLPLVKIRKKTSYIGIGQKLGRPIIHTHHIWII